MLKRVIAPEGWGKTSLIHREIAEKAARGERVYLIVPEQITAETERAVLSLSGARAADRVEITNFSRLPDLVFRETGGAAKRCLSPVDKEILLAACAQELKDQFRAIGYKNLSDFAVEARRALRDMKTAGVDREQFEKAEKSEAFDERLKNKIEDLFLLDAAFRAELHGKFDDPDEEIARLAAVLKKAPFFRDAYVYIDSFWDFTGEELSVIREMLVQAKEVWISFCCEKEAGDLFRKGFDAAVRLRRIAESAGCPVENVFLPAPEKEKGEIAFLKRRLLSGGEKSEATEEEIHLTACRSRLDEARFVAGEIRRLAASGVRWREIAVLSRTGADDDLFGFVFDECAIPHFSEEKSALAESALAETILKGAALALGDTRPETLRQYLKNAILPISEEERHFLKKYAVTWSDPVRAWFSPVPFTRDADGMVMGTRKEKELEAAKKELDAVNFAKEKVFAPLRALAAGLTAKENRAKIEAVVDFLRDNRTEEVIFQKIAEKKAAGDTAAAGALARNWNTVLQRLDAFSAAAGDRDSDAASFRELLLLSLSGKEAGAVPPTQDLVMLGSLPFTRQKAKYVFLTGMNAGVFPPEETASGILTSRDHYELARAFDGFESREKEALNEYFLFYLALSFTEKELFLSFTVDEGKWKDALSPVVRSALSVLGRGDREPVFFDGEKTMPRDERSLFRYLLKNAEKSRPDLNVLKEYFLKNEETAPLLLDAAAGKAFWKSDLPLQRNRPFPGGSVGTSYSRLETYSKCHYQYFAQYLLKAKPLEKASFSAAGAGSFVHAVLEEALGRLQREKKALSSLSDQELKELNQAVCRDVTASLLPLNTDARTAALLRRLERSAYLLLDTLRREFSESGFQPIFQEKELADLGGGYKIPLPDGKTLTFFGSIDRVDRYRKKDGKEYVRVVDYKTGGHDFSLAGVANGVDVQMLIYLFALMENGYTLENETVRHPLPAGILYLNGLFEPRFFKNDQKKDEFLGKNGVFTRTGLLLDDDEILAVQDPAGRGYLPVYMGGRGGKQKKNGIGGVLISLENMGRLKKKVEQDFARLVMKMKEGDVEAYPLYSEEAHVTPCRYCKYRAMCKNDKDHLRPYRTVRELKEEDVFGKEEKENG